MTFQWEVRDGYAGKSRPQYTVVNDDELLECDTPEEAQQLVEDAIQDDYNNYIAPEWDKKEVAEQIKQLFEKKEAQSIHRQEG